MIRHPETELGRIGHWTIVYSIFFLFLFSGCTDSQPDTTARVDALNRSVHVPATVQSVSSLAPSVTETIYAAHAASKLVSVTTVDNFPDEVRELTMINSFPLDIEGLVSLKPDLIIASDQVNRVDEAERLAELGLPVFFLSSNSIEGILENIETVADILSSPAGREQAQLLRDAVEMISSRVSEANETHPSVLILIDYKELYAFGQGSYVHEIVRRAGGTSVTDHFSVTNPVLSEEFVLRTNPDIIVGTFGTAFEIEDLLSIRPTWSSLAAVKNNKVFNINPDILLRPGPRTVDALAIMANWITPTAFQTTI